MDEVKCVTLGDKREIHLHDGDDDFSISIVSDGKVLFDLPLPFPRRGYAGGSLCVSPVGTYLLFAYYSGQSEEAFMLFKIKQNALEMVFESPYRYGEAASYGFSDDEKLLVQGLPFTCSEWERPWLEKDVKTDADGHLFFEFGKIKTLNMASMAMNEYMIRIYPAHDWHPEQVDYEPYMFPRMIAGDALKISMPWGDEILRLPLKDPIIFTVGGQ